MTPEFEIGAIIELLAVIEDDPTISIPSNFG